MHRTISSVTYLVRDYDGAIGFFISKLGFHLVEDRKMSPEKRWVLVAPTDSPGPQLLLARADGKQQEALIGNQAGGRVFLFLQTDDFWRDYEAMRSAGVRFTEQPREEAYGTVAVFMDLYGNLWDLIEPHN